MNESLPRPSGSHAQDALSPPRRSVRPRLSVVVPALREAENIPVLAARLDAALSGLAGGYEILIVDDDSRDGTEAVAAELAKRLPISLLTRRPPRDGLSGAVLDGFKLAAGEVLVVMDADLQHPPEKVPELVTALDRGDFALGSRYTAGGGIEGSWSPFRALNSRLATLLARPFAPGITDPMSGFFALRRSTLDRAERLTPLGYKIALELICKCRVARSAGGQGVVEVPIRFHQRELGESKLSVREQFRYLEHLSRLYDYTFPRASPVAKFVISVVLAFVPAGLVYGWLPSIVALGQVTRLAVAYPVAIAITALLHLRYVSAQRDFIARPKPWHDFIVISLLEYIGVVLSAAYFAGRMREAMPTEKFLLPVLVGTFIRYAMRKELLHDIRGLGRDFRKFD